MRGGDVQERNAAGKLKPTRYHLMLIQVVAIVNVIVPANSSPEIHLHRELDHGTIRAINVYAGGTFLREHGALPPNQRRDRAPTAPVSLDTVTGTKILQAGMDR
jgi:hypothetical protein